MKLTFRQIEPFVQNPDPKARVIVIYGPDQGLVTERSKAICMKTVPNLNDPFNVIHLTTPKIMDDKSIFYDEANAQSLMGGNRLIIIKDGADSLTPILKDYLEDAPSQETVVVVEAGDLNPRSALRKLAESAKNAVALPCYVDDERNLSQIIRDMCTHAGYGIESDALHLFSPALVGDRAIARNEIEKLLLYKGLDKNYTGYKGDPVRSKIGTITTQDVYATCGDIRDWSMDKLIYVIGDGDTKTTHIIIDSLFRDKIAPIILLRSTQNHFWRLYSTNVKIKDGMPMQDAVKTLSPPLFFKVEDAFKRQLNRWSLPVLENALDALTKAEALTKKTGYNPESITRNCLIQLSRYQPNKRRAA
jgi:DNA polymerase-3 subunit delta